MVADTDPMSLVLSASIRAIRGRVIPSVSSVTSCKTRFWFDCCSAAAMPDCRDGRNAFHPRAMEIPENCLHCGVCCFAKSGTYVRVSEADWARLGPDADRVARHVGRQAFMRMEDGHCAALHVTTRRSAPPVFFCTLYDRRPQVCRHLARGSAACQTELRNKAARVAVEYGR